MDHLFDRLNDKTTDSDYVSIFISNLIINNSQIVRSPNSRTSNFLLFIEALYIKHKSPALNTGLKASKKTYAFSLIFSSGCLSSCHNTYTPPHKSLLVSCCWLRCEFLPYDVTVDLI